MHDQTSSWTSRLGKRMDRLEWLLGGGRPERSDEPVPERSWGSSAWRLRALVCLIGGVVGLVQDHSKSSDEWRLIFTVGAIVLVVLVIYLRRRRRRSGADVGQSGR